MFVGIYYSRKNEYIVEDTDFKETTTNNGIYAVLDVYGKKNLPIAPNLKLFYQQYLPKYRQNILTSDLAGVMRFMPETDFQRLYYPCVKRHLDKLNWIGK